MPNLFFYVGTVFLRENGTAPVGIQNEAQFALSNLLPREMVWERVCNTNLQTMGRPDTAGTRTFVHAKDASGGSAIESTLGKLTKSALDIVGHADTVVGASIPSTSVLPTAPDNQRRVDVGGTVVGNSSGRIQKQELDALITAMRGSLGSDKLFAVGDCNSFHNVAYIFANVALHGKPAPILVLNVDQHRDMGRDANQDFVSSDTWGTSMLADTTGAYLSVGSGGPNGGNQVVGQYRAHGGGLEPFRPAAISAATVTGGAGLAVALNGMLTTLQGAGGVNQLFQSVYITVDRDCMLNNWTQWRDRAAVFPHHRSVVAFLESFMTELVATSNGVKLVGMDITGLPENGAGPIIVDEAQGLAFPDTVSYRYANLRQELSDYHDFFSRWTNRNQGGVQGYIESASKGLRCCRCGTEHGHVRSSYVGRWHRCATCQRVYCSSCGGKLERADARDALIDDGSARERRCPGTNFNGQVCDGVTALID